MLLCVSLCELEKTTVARCEAIPDVPRDAIPFLPPELEQLIFEMAAFSCKPDIPTLCRVAQRVRKWTIPVWYRVIIRQGDYDPNKTQAPPTPSQALYVKDLLLTVSSTPEDVLTYLTLCTRVENVASWPRFESGELLPLFNALPNLRRLSINLLTLFGGERPDFGHTVWRNVTHLDIVDEFQSWWHDEDDAGYGVTASTKPNTLTMLPKLTHIAFNDRVPKEVVIDLLRKSSPPYPIQVIVLLGDHTDELADALPGDPRIVMDVNSGQGGWVEDWRRGAEEGGDFWVRAEEIIEAKRERLKERDEVASGDDDVDVVELHDVGVSAPVLAPVFTNTVPAAQEISVQA
ncbi:hypothetical protein BDN72DRAFT_963665 [Pluteus cervinus]|uniref:Uncharacterized protein n=1 Tax=Pluteus cervinus TaxID=181527 RepID=A0ACD3ADJ8_9AGAR|nr:hypothetical protein BDN72DRAFT_963665 [Pluteus cervinus]